MKKKYTGWIHWAGGQYDYYPDDGTDDAFTQAITLVYEDRIHPESNLVRFNRGEGAETRTVTETLPASVRTLEEAKAWAVAAWRMG